MLRPQSNEGRRFRWGVGGYIHYGNVGAYGTTYNVEKVDGRWKVTGKSGIEVMS